MSVDVIIIGVTFQIAFQFVSSNYRTFDNLINLINIISDS